MFLFFVLFLKFPPNTKVTQVVKKMKHMRLQLVGLQLVKSLQSKD